MDLKITGAKLSGDAEKDVKTLANHVFQLEEQLRYQLRNLDVTNFNDLGLARYENGRLQVYAEQVEIQAEKLRLEFGKETDEIRTQFEATVDGFKATVEGYGSDVKGYAEQVSSFEQTASSISAKVSGVANDSGNVTAASIVAAINDAGSSVKISANHIDLEGDFVTISDLAGTGKVEINAGNIAAGGTISGCRFETTQGEVGKIVIDQTYISMGDNYVELALSRSGLFGIFNYRGGIEFAFKDRLRFYDNDYRIYWELYPRGFVCHDATTGEVIRELLAVDV